MPNYEYGKIYKISSNQTDEIYIGSTTQSLSMRMAGHRSNYKRYVNNNNSYITSFKILQYEDSKIELIEKYSCKNNKELHNREGYWIKELKSINICIAGRTPKQYREEHKELQKKNCKLWYEKNKNEYLEKKRKKKHCNICNIDIGQYDFKRHERSLSHQDKIKLIN